jgi:hypothetical protein
MHFFSILLLIFLSILNASCDDQEHTQSYLDMNLVGGFNDHTMQDITRTEFFELAASQYGKYSLKFYQWGYHSAPKLNQLNEVDMRFMDARFYQLHDEYYWFRLMNGQEMYGFDTEPFEQMRFDSVQQITSWANQQVNQGKTLPLDLRFVSDRLYSPYFYEVALSDVSPVVVGTLSYFQPKEGRKIKGEIWCFELEYSDATSPAQIHMIAQKLRERLGPEIGDQLYWMIRSPIQEKTAQEISNQRLAEYDRLLRYDDVIIPGEVEVYSEGISAGRVHLMDVEELTGNQNQPQANDILIYPTVPDLLPSCQGLITSIPQTPLAHINLLARNRGIPNLYLGGAVSDPKINQLGSIRAPVILKSTFPNQYVLHAISEMEYQQWLTLNQPQPKTITPVDLNGIEYLYDLQTLSFEDALKLRPVIGGKNAGMVALLRQPILQSLTPYQPMAISIKAYDEFIQPLMPMITELLKDKLFIQDPRVRAMALEDEDFYRATYTDQEDIDFANAIKAGEIPSAYQIDDHSILLTIIGQNGLKKVIRKQDFSETLNQVLIQPIKSHFGALSEKQGLRFRSSSNVEDIEGFNGAGLYESHTGFIYPEKQPTEDQKKDLAYAIKKAWASYWGVEAFDERKREKIDHLSGQMALLVHPRFEDEMEKSNGVITFTMYPLDQNFPSSSRQKPQHFNALALMEINAQVGSLSITNPEKLDALPEVTQVMMDLNGHISIERLQGSTESNGLDVLSDAQNLALFEQMFLLTHSWRNQVNQDLKKSQNLEALVLDIEFREVKEGWPQLASGEILESRIVVKQARPLEPSPRNLPATFQEKPIPRDILRRINKTIVMSCENEVLKGEFTMIWTDPLKSPKMGYEEQPFISELHFSAKEDSQNNRDRVWLLHHLNYEAELLSYQNSNRFELSFIPRDQVILPFQKLVFKIDQNDHRFEFLPKVENGEENIQMGNITCQSNLVYATPNEYLNQLLEQAN